MLPVSGRHTARTQHGLADSVSGQSGRGSEGHGPHSAGSQAALLPRKGMCASVGSYVKEFFEQSTLHGLRYMILEKGNYFEV